jgi:hypothetical protein
MAMLKRQSILSFVFVRHPLDRLESAYYDKIVGKPSDTFYKMVKNIKAKCKILKGLFIYPKYSKLSTVAHTIDFVCSKILNHG